VEELSDFFPQLASVKASKAKHNPGMSVLFILYETTGFRN
jgi:hypothetical protein